MEHLKDQYRHCKAILVLGASSALLDAAQIPATLLDGSPDSALVRAESGTVQAGIEQFMAAMAQHRNFKRETDPPMV